jgi:hypothetical protein
MKIRKITACFVILAFAAMFFGGTASALTRGKKLFKSEMLSTIKFVDTNGDGYADQVLNKVTGKAVALRKSVKMSKIPAKLK